MNLQRLPQHSLRRISVCLAAFLLASAATLGCGGGSSTAHLQGTITLGGKPLPPDAVGMVIFSPVGDAKSKPASATISNGQYDSPNTPTGRVLATFDITQPSGPEYTTSRGITARDMKSIVPEKSKSGVEIEVTGNNSAQDFNLE